MAKNDWINGATGTRTNMNQPFWLASGTYNAGSTRIELQVSPGSARFPGQSGLQYSGQAQQYLINNPAASTFYTVFVRSDLSFITSGTLSLADPGPPRWDAEAIGQIFTGASLSTANLVGPWNQGAFGGYEQRGQYTPTNKRRVVWDYRTAIPQGTPATWIGGTVPTMGSIPTGFTGANATIASGLSFLSMNDSSFGNYPNGGTLLEATVVWQPSGAIGRVQPGFAIGYIKANAGTLGLCNIIDGIYNTVAANPDSASNSPMIRTTAMQVLCTGLSAAGYRLDIGSGASDDLTAVRISSVSFVARPGLFASNLIEVAPGS